MYTAGVEHPEVMTFLRHAGLRSTPQRMAIMKEVFALGHPTVTEVYEVVRREFPTIGLATVYNTLRTMTDRGLVTELPFADSTRFEPNRTPHVNLVCRSCGAIEDSDLVDADLIEEIRGRAASAAFRPETQRIDIYGLCRRCM